jgi:hypothetical protein
MLKQFSAVSQLGELIIELQTTRTLSSGTLRA